MNQIVKYALMGTVGVPAGIWIAGQLGMQLAMGYVGGAIAGAVGGALGGWLRQKQGKID